MIDWRRNKRLLVEGTQSAVRAFLAKKGRNDLCSVGYVFELGNASPAFFLCADTRTYRSQCPDAETDEARWNSGGFEYPAALLSLHELGPEWADEVARLPSLAEDASHFREVYDGLITICCEALAELAPTGLFGDWTQVDFNVSEVGDPIERVRERDRHIRQLLAAKAGTEAEA
jgi:hypothetical protein